MSAPDGLGNLQAGWEAGDGPDDIVTGPLPALRTLAARFSERLEAVERLSFCEATVARDQSLGLADQRWLLSRERHRLGRDAAILAALNLFVGNLAAAIVGDRPPDQEQEQP